MSRIRVFAASLLLSAFAAAAAAADTVDADAINRVRDAAMRSDYAYRQAGWLSDRIGPRLSGSRGHAAAIEYVAEQMKQLGLKVSLQPVKVPHWVRGEETASLVDYPGRPDGITQKVMLTALGSSSATPPDGLTREVVVVHSLDELKALGRRGVQDKFVLLYSKFDQFMADNGHAGEAYGLAGAFRFGGPNEVSKLGGAAALVRSVGGAEYRLPHTGATHFAADVAAIPAAALSAEDADLIVRLAEHGPVRLHMTLTPQTLPDVDSFNVIGDLRGSDRPDEIVIISGHLDSWDLGTGAHDDAVGVATAMSAAAMFKQLRLKPRRTLRVIAWANEENGTRGGKTYFEAQQQEIEQHAAAIESDFGGGRPVGVYAHVTEDTLELLKPLNEALKPIGASLSDRRTSPTGADISPLGRAGVPSFAPLVDSRSYFDYHHTAADTFDKLDPEAVRYQSSVMATLAWWLANTDEVLPRVPVPPATMQH